MSNEHAGPEGDFVGPQVNGDSVNPQANSNASTTFQIQVTNVPSFGLGAGNAYIGINHGGYCFLTSDPTQAVLFTQWTDSEGRRFISTPNGWLSYGGATPYYAGQWATISNQYQTWIKGGTLSFDGGVLCFYSDGSNTWLYNQNEGTVGYTPCTTLPADPS